MTGDDALLLAVFQAALALTAILFGVLGVGYALFVNLLQGRTEDDPLLEHAVLVGFRRICRGSSVLVLLTVGIAAGSLPGLSATSASAALLAGALVLIAAVAALGACYLSFFTML